MNILIKIAYDGTNYFGWQKQKYEKNTIQEKIENAFFKLLNKNISIRGASRTDSGVHSLGQRALIKDDIVIPINKIPFALNSVLPSDIVVTDAEYVNDDFHPQYSVIKKTYEYKILNDKFRNPMLRNYSEFVYSYLDIEKMQEASKYFIGTHDFKAFCSSGGNSKTTIRTIFDLTIERNNNIINIKVSGNGFLYNMVRIIVGTLIYVGENKIMPSDISNIILSKDRAKAGKTVSPKGLTLVDIYY